jgi:hypothetical protein
MSKGAWHDHTRYHSVEELRENGFAHLRNAVAVLENKATTEELGEYRRFVLTLAGKVGAAHREHGQTVNPAEAEVICGCQHPPRMLRPGL